MFITALFTIARTWKPPRCPLADEWIRKLWYIYTMEYYSAIKKNASESVLMRWMKLRPIIQSEVSQKEKHQYSILMHIYMEFRKMEQQPYMQDNKRDTDVKNRLWTLWEKATVGTIQEKSIETCILSYVKQITSASSMNEAGTQSWCSGTTQREGMGRKVGGGFRMVGHMYTHG